ncbi:MAG: response regulator [Chloroflexi bacterium]|nr:response regulator [Chloroflexota bacterium]
MLPRIDVLVIEDSNDLRSVLLQVLAEEGYRVAGADNGLDGLRLVAELEPRMVLCDVMLPGMDGVTIWRESREVCARAGTAFVLTSAVSIPGARAAGVPFLPKPFELDDLLAMVERNTRPAATAPATQPLAVPAVVSAPK